jgi:hypothetical protein
MKVLLLTIMFIFPTFAEEPQILELTEKSLKEYIANKKVSLKISIKNGIVFHDCYIKEKSSVRVFSNKTFKLLPAETSIIIPRSFGKVNIALTQIKEISLTNSTKNLYVKTQIDFTTPSDLLGMIEIKEFKKPGSFNDLATLHLPEIAAVLTELYLTGASITDKSIKNLGMLKNLTDLSLSKKFTKSGQEKLQNLLPKTTIFR